MYSGGQGVLLFMKVVYGRMTNHLFVYPFPFSNRFEMNSSLRAMLALTFIPLIFACQPEDATVGLADTELSDGQLVQRYCASCHLFPEPGLLDRDTWLSSVLPAMSWRLGIRDTAHRPLMGRTMNEQYLIRQANIFPDSTLLSEASWQRIVNYYDSLAPAQLPVPAAAVRSTPSNAPFHPQPVSLQANTDGLLTLLRQDSTTGKIYLVDGLRTLYQLNAAAHVEQSFLLPGAISDIHFRQDGSMYLLAIGDLNPHDEPLGELLLMNVKGSIDPLISNLNRPVHLNVHDLDQDGREDMIICEFGNYIGRLSWFRQTEDSTFEKRVLWEQPGAVKTYVRDLDDDGRPDIVVLMAQGREGVYAFYNRGEGRFEMKPMLRFPSVYGSSDFTLTDVDQDGDEDIVLANGDNADLSDILKPYHGLRVYRNEGNYEFAEAYFYPLYGATRAVSEDFDQDGDIDLATSAYFPDFAADEPRSFVYLENISTDSLAFVPHVLDGLNVGRWLFLEPFRRPGQSAPGLMLGASNLRLKKGIEEQVARWDEEHVNLMLLESK